MTAPRTDRRYWEIRVTLEQGGMLCVAAELAPDEDPVAYLAKLKVADRFGPIAKVEPVDHGGHMFVAVIGLPTVEHLTAVVSEPADRLRMSALLADFGNGIEKGLSEAIQAAGGPSAAHQLVARNLWLTSMVTNTEIVRRAYARLSEQLKETVILAEPSSSVN